MKYVFAKYIYGIVIFILIKLFRGHANH